jgi:hypothetical protein
MFVRISQRSLQALRSYLQARASLDGGSGEVYRLCRFLPA